MPVAVNQPQRREEEDPLTKIAKGLQIASSVYGIKDASDKAELLKKDQGQKDILFQQNQDEFNRKQAGISTAGELLDKQKDFDIAKPGDKDAMAYQVQRGDNVETVYLKRKAPVQDPTQTEYRQLLQQERLRKFKDEQDKVAFEKTPEGRISKLTGDKVKRFDEAKMGLQAVNGMASALDAGDNTFSVIGDNDFTRNSSLFNEAIGRMQSGGAINAEEAKNFRALAPTKMDSADQQRKKLVNLQNEFASRLGTLGFKPEEAGISVADFSYGKPQITAEQAQQELIKRKGLAGVIPKK